MHTRRLSRDAKRLRSRRIRALLAGGLVLGVGAAATLAAWNDSEFGSGTFTASRFGIVGSVNGGAFAEHNTAAAPASLAFQLPATAAAMTPGDTVYVLFSVKTIASSTTGTLQLVADPLNNAGLGQYLTYGVRTVASTTTCDSTTFTGGDATGLPANAALTVGSSAPRALAANGGTALNYCFAVTLPTGANTAAQGTSLTAKWSFVATSS